MIKYGAISFKKPILNKSYKIPKRVTIIGDWAFFNSPRLKKIEIPDTIESIRRWAFESCDKLEEVTVPINIRDIGEGAFKGCTSLKSATILSNKLEELPPGIFCSCKSLEHVNVPASIKKIGRYAFESCESLQELSLSDKIVIIGIGAFEGCSNLHLSIGTSLFNMDLDEFKETFNVKTLTLYNYNISMPNYKIDIRKIRAKELKDKIDAYLIEHNISDSKYFEDSLHKNFINQMLTYFENFKGNFISSFFGFDDDSDYKKMFNEYMDDFIRQIQNNSISLNGNFNKSLTLNNVSCNQNNQNNSISLNSNFNKSLTSTIPSNQINNNPNSILDYLKDYAKALGLEEKLYEIKKEIDGYLTIKNVSDAKSFSYDAHIGFIKEVLESLSHDKNYNYIEAINNYMQNYVESLNPEIKKREDITYKDIPISLYEYGKKLNLLNKIKEIKNRIDKCLKENGITDKKSFSYDIHQGFIMEMLDCINNDKEYDYNDAVNNYVKYSVLSVNNNVNNQNQLEEKENEILMLKKQIEELNKKILEMESNNMAEDLGRKK